MRRLQDATTGPKFDYFKRHIDLQMQAASGWVAWSASSAGVVSGAPGAGGAAGMAECLGHVHGKKVT
jgi:hypothetical protein